MKNYVPTYFFLGAGASHGFGFPCGNSLVQEICDDLQNESPLKAYLRDGIHMPAKDLENFAETFIDAKIGTLDEFIRTKQGLLAHAKLIVGAKLIAYEDPANLRKAKKDWLTTYLNGRLNGCDTYYDARDALESVFFCTLNYDRTVEYIIFMLLKARYGDNCPKDNEVIGFANGRVRHLHGLLGNFVFNQKPNARLFTNELPQSRSELESICNDLTFWSEHSNNSDDYEILNIQLEPAARVFILGFGFHQSILRRFLPNAFSGKEIFCTVFEITQNQWGRFLVRFGKGLCISGDIPMGTKKAGNATFGDVNQTCDDFMKEIMQDLEA